MKPDIRLLIVDDNIVTRYALRRRLECHGYRIDEAGTGGEGLELIASQTYDALILDVHLPDMSGFDIVRILRATPATALLPVIHVSAAAIGTGDIITGLDAGADAYLIHPVDPEVLLATLRTLLRVRGTEQALRESEARFREIFVSTAAPIALLGTGLKVHECNQAFAQLIQDNLSPDTLVECFADDQQPVIDELLRRLGTRDRWKGLLHMRVNGQLRETQWQVSPYRSGESSLIFVEDVTEQRHRERTQRAELDSATTLLAQEVAERARTEAQLLQVQKMDALGKLTGGIAHDFNNMLTGIITSLELIKKRIEQGRVDKVQSYADAALGAAMGAATLTHRLLAFARQQPLDPRPADINQHIRSLEELLRRTIGEHISLHLNLSEHLSVALVDPIQLENAVLNLVINARDALPQGGNIWISTYAAHTQDDLKLADGAYVALSVRDDGSGIAPEVIGKVFDPFFTTKPIGQGTGLGLSTIYGFARQSAGDVQIRSTGGRGTEVTLLLPASQSPLLSTTEPTPDTVISTAGEHVLVVEDMSVVRSFVCEVLTDAGYRCTPAPDVESALQKLHADPSIALLLSDVGLPHMNGRELANVARMLRPSLPVLFMTGYAENAIDRQHFLGERMDIVTKPFQIHELLDKVRRSLDA